MALISRLISAFGNKLFSDLSKLHQRMAFVLKAAARFDELLQGSNRYQIEQAIWDIAAGRRVSAERKTCGEGACRNAAPPRWGAQRP